MLHHPEVGIGFFDARLLLYVGHRGETLLHACAPEQLSALVQTYRLADKPCAVSLPTVGCRVKTVTLARVTTAELRRITQQDYFWQESLGVTSAEFSVFWRVLPNCAADQVALLLAALPRTRQQSCLAPITRARLRVERQSIACFDLLAATRSSTRHVTVVLGHDACLIAATRSGISLQSLAHLDADRLQDIQSLSALLPKLADSVRKLFANEAATAAVHATSVTVISTATAASNEQIRLGLPPLLPAWCTTRLVTPAQIVQRYAHMPSTKVVATQVSSAMLLTTASVIATVRARCKTHPDFSRTPAIRYRQRVRRSAFAVLFAASALLLICAYVHWGLLHERTRLQAQLLRHADLSAAHAQRLQAIESLRQKQEHHAAVVVDMQQLRAVHAGYLRLLALVASSMVADLRVEETAFHAPASLRIHGQAHDSRAVAQFVERLRRHDLVRHAAMKSLVTETDSSRQAFTLECELELFTASAGT